MWFCISFAKQEGKFILMRIFMRIREKSKLTKNKIEGEQSILQKIKM